MPAVITAIIEFAAYYAAEEEVAAAGYGALAASLAGAAAAAVAGYETARWLAEPGPSNLKASTAAGAQIDAVGTYSGIPVLYGARRVGGIRVLTESASSSLTVGNESVRVVASYKTQSFGAAYFLDIGVYSISSAVITQWGRVGSAPGPMQYSVIESGPSAGTYTFNAADTGKMVGIRYQAAVSNNQLHMVIVWGMGPIDSVAQLYLDDVPVTDLRFAGYVYAEHYLGTDTQAASAALISAFPKWTAAHQLRGLAYSYIRLDWNESVFPRGKPNISADIRGMQVFDPRTGLTEFSNNPWLCVRDFLTSTRYGWKVPAASIDDASIISEANYAEQRVSAPTFSVAITADPAADTVTFPSPPGFFWGHGVQLAGASLPAPLVAATTYYTIPVVNTLSAQHPVPTVFKLATSFLNALRNIAIDLTTAGSGTILSQFIDMPRYACNGVLDIDRRRLDNMRSLLSSCRGFLVFSGGLYKARSEKVSSAVGFTLNEDNIVGGWSVQLPQRRTQYNRMRANFFDAANLWQSNSAVQDSTVYRASDGGSLAEASLDLPFTTSVYTANQLAMMELKQSRFGIGVMLRANISALQLEVGDIVPVTHTTPGWVSQLFRVARVEPLANDEIGIGLTQYDPGVYTLDALSYVNPPPATNLPDPSQVLAPGTPVILEILYATTGSAGVKSQAQVSWTASPDPFVRNGGYYRLEVSPTGQNVWSVYSHIQALFFNLNDMAPGTYDFRSTAVNSLGVLSPYAVTTKELIGLSAPPSDVQNFAVQSYSSQAKFTWKKYSANSDLDVTIGGRVFVRWSPKTVGATWNDGTLVNPDGYPGDTSIGFGPLTTGTYMAKAMDSSGNFSVNEASFIVTEAVLTALSTITTLTESPTFAGAKTNVYVDGVALQLAGTTLIDSMVALIDSWGSVDGLGGISATGSYAFGSKMDLGSVQPCRLYANIDSTAFDVDDLIDSRTDPIDNWGLFDGAVIEDAEVQLMVRATNDDPNAAPAWGPWHALGQAGDYNNRGFDFRLDFATANATHNRKVTTLAVAAKH